MKPASPEAFKLLLDGSLALAQVEANGIKIDTDYLEHATAKIVRRIKRLREKLEASDEFKLWRRAFGQKTNLGSREQLATVLFDKLKLPYEGELTKTGRWKADEESFAKLDLLFVKEYVELEKLKKAKGTYLEGISREVCDGILRPSFTLNTVTTYRGACNDPNFTNIPVRDPEMGKLIRQAFVARDGCRIVEVDYSGIEVRVSACYHKDPAMLAYIRDPSKDMHRDMAADCFLLPQNQVSKDSRYVAKNQFVFPQFYGDYYLSCARGMWNAMERMRLALPDGTPLKDHLASKGIKKLGACDPKLRPKPGTFEAHIKKIEDYFWNVRFPIYKRWKDDWYAAYRRQGGFRMLTGFVETGLYSKNDVTNHPVQGAAFHCLLWSLIELQRRLTSKKMGAKIVGQIHDSIIADVPDNEVNHYLTLAKRVMTVLLPRAWDWIIVPLEVEAEVTPIGGNWHQKEAWVERDGKWGPKEAAK